MAKNKVDADIAVIKNQIVNLSSNFQEFKNDNKKFYGSITKKVNTIENKEIALEQRVSLLAGFQSVLSIIIGGIAAFLGSRR